MRILQYSHTALGGHRRYVIELARALAERAEVILVSAESAADEPGLRQIAVLSAPADLTGLRRLANRIAVYARQPKEFGSMIRSLGIEQGDYVCHFQELPSLLPERIVRKAQSAGFRSVATVHNVKPHGSGITERAKQLMRRRAWRRCDRLVVHSRSLVSALVKEVGVPESRIAVVPHPVWPVEREPASPSRTFLFFGHLRENKGLWLFVESLRLLKDPPASIIGSGTPEQVRRIKEELALFGLHNCELRPGFVPEPELAQLFGQHAVVVAPYTHFVAQSGVTHLAVSFGRPMVVTNVGALADLVHEFGVGEVADARAESVAGAMNRAALLQGSGIYEPRLELARRRLSPAAVADSLIECYEETALLSL